MTCLRKVLPLEVQELVKAYASDKIGVHPTAALIKRLKFQPIFPEFRGLVLPATLVQCPQGAGYFMHLPYLEFVHHKFDERNFPAFFYISLRWDNMRRQDEIEAMGAEDIRH